MSGFFDRYQCFKPDNRLNKRHQALFETRPDIYKGARVLDIASHDGRWSFAALRAGAAHVTAVEPRPNLVRRAQSNFSDLRVPSSQYQFLQADIFQYFASGLETFDVILCLGFFYHTYRHPELMAEIKRRNPKFLVIDSQINLQSGLICTIACDRTSEDLEAVADNTTRQGYIYAATPSRDLLLHMASQYGFKSQIVDWQPILRDGNVSGVEDYAEGRRITLICEAK